MACNQTEQRKHQYLLYIITSLPYKPLEGGHLALYTRKCALTETHYMSSLGVGGLLQIKIHLKSAADLNLA